MVYYRAQGVRALGCFIMGVTHSTQADQRQTSTARHQARCFCCCAPQARCHPTAAAAMPTIFAALLEAVLAFGALPVYDLARVNRSRWGQLTN
jgi:hypothetical protein